MVAGEPVSVLSADTSQPARPLSGCMVHTERILNLRAAPDTGSDVRALVPYDVTLTATQREGAWYQVDYLGLSGWLSAAYLTPQGSCD